MSASVVHWDEVKKNRVEQGELCAAWTNLGAATGTVGVGLRRVEIDPGRRSTPVHVHGAEEELFFVLAGSGMSWQEGDVYDIGPGDLLVHLPGGKAHTLIAGDEGLDVLAFGNRVAVETGWLPRAHVTWLGKTWVAAGEGAHPWARELAAGELARPAQAPLSAAPTGAPATASDGTSAFAAAVLSEDAPALAPVADSQPRPPSIVNVHDVEEQATRRGDCIRIERDLGEAAGSRRTGLRHVLLPPGTIGAPPHCHSADEEIFVVLDGDGVLMLGGEDHPVRRGSVVARPPGTRRAHAFRAGEIGLTYLAYGTREPHDISFYPRSNRIYLRAFGVTARVDPADFTADETW